MPKQITSGPSDCISSIAFDEGFFPDTLWNLPENAHLKEDTDFSTVLAEGEVVYVPDLRDKSVGVPTDARHRFKRHGVPEKVRIRFLDELGKPRSGLSYQFRTSLGIKAGTTDGDGVLTEFIRPDETEALLALQTKAGLEEYVLDLGCLRPRTVDRGARRRLTQLGYWPDLGDSAGEPEQLRLAVSAFQVAENLTLTGELDAATLDRLKAAYGC
jgi:hypothetical protein